MWEDEIFFFWNKEPLILIVNEQRCCTIQTLTVNPIVVMPSSHNLSYCQWAHLTPYVGGVSMCFFFSCTFFFLFFVFLQLPLVTQWNLKGDIWPLQMSYCNFNYLQPDEKREHDQYSTPLLKMSLKHTFVGWQPTSVNVRARSLQACKITLIHTGCLEQNNTGLMDWTRSWQFVCLRVHMLQITCTINTILAAFPAQGNKVRYNKNAFSLYKLKVIQHFNQLK